MITINVNVLITISITTIVTMNVNNTFLTISTTMYGVGKTHDYNDSKKHRIIYIYIYRERER